MPDAKKNIKPLNLKKFLPYRLSTVTNKISYAFSKLYSDKFGLTVNEWRIVAVLGQFPGLSADAICKTIEMDKVTVSRSVTKLLNKKYIDRDFAEKDRRHSILKLSRTGCKVYARIVPIAREFEKQLVQTLSRSDLENLEALLDKLNHNIPHIKL